MENRNNTRTILIISSLVVLISVVVMGCAPEVMYGDPIYTVTTFVGDPTSSSILDSDEVDGPQFNYPEAITRIGTNLYVIDDDSSLRRVDLSTGIVTTLNGDSFSHAYSLTTDGTNLFMGSAFDVKKLVLDTSDGYTIELIAGSGLQGSYDDIGTNATFNSLDGICLIGTDLYVSDMANYTIRKIDLSDTNYPVTTIAGSAGSKGDVDDVGLDARFSNPWGLVTDGENLYVADAGVNKIKMITIDTTADPITYTVSTIAGDGTVGSSDGVGASAQFYSPRGIFFDGSDLYVADMRNNTIRKLDPTTQQVTTIAGDPTTAAGWADGVGENALFDYPMGITAYDSDLYVADAYNYSIRKIEVEYPVL